MKPYLIAITVVVILSIVGFLFFGSIGSNANRQGGSTRATNGTGAPEATTSIQNTTQALNSSLPIGPSAAAPRLIKTIPADISGFPVVDPKNGYMYVPTTQGSILVLSGASIIANITGDYSPWVFYDPQDSNIYAYNSSNKRLFAAVAISGTSVTAKYKTIPMTPCEVYDPKNGYLYASTKTNNTVISGGSAIAYVKAEGIPACMDGPGVYDPKNGYIYEAGPNNNVSVMSNASVIAKLGVGVNPSFMVVDQQNGYVYVLNTGGTTSYSISVISGTAVIANISVPWAADQLLYNSENGYIYVLDSAYNTRTGNVSVISGTSDIADIPIGDNLDYIAYDPKSGYVYALAGNGAAVISGTSIIATVPATLGASVALYNPKNGYMYVFGKQNASIMSGTSTIANVGGISSIQGYANFANAYYMAVVYDPLNGYVYAMNRQAIYVLS